MNTISNQELFDKVAKHLLTQGKPAMDDSGGCMYRSPSGLMCAVGCLIDDKHYNPGFEGEGLGDMDGPPSSRIIRAVADSLRVRMSDSNISLLQSLQKAHDRASILPVDDGNYVPLFIQKLDRVARLFDLNAEVLDKHEQG